jgi:magnesium transporter
MSGQLYDAADEIAVCAGAALVGLVPIETLLGAPDAALLGDLADLDPPIVGPDTDQEVAAWKAIRHGEVSLAVVNAQGEFVGLVPPQRLLEVLLREHDEDLARLTGSLRSASLAISASNEPVPLRIWHRAPWLVVGLLGAFLAAEVVATFEERMQALVALAFFIPGIVYLADAVGTQTEALAIRGLSVGVGIGQIVWREAFTGVLMGTTLAAAFFPVALWRWGGLQLALTVSLTILAACCIATIIALALPWALHKSGQDPAFGSGPLATVIQDILSLLIYFGIASAMLQ